MDDDVLRQVQEDLLLHLDVERRDSGCPCTFCDLYRDLEYDSGRDPREIIDWIVNDLLPAVTRLQIE